MISVFWAKFGYSQYTCTLDRVVVSARYSKKETGFNFCDTILPYHNIVLTKVLASYRQVARLKTRLAGLMFFYQKGSLFPNLIKTLNPKFTYQNIAVLIPSWYIVYLNYN